MVHSNKNYSTKIKLQLESSMRGISRPILLKAIFITLLIHLSVELKIKQGHTAPVSLNANHQLTSPQHERTTQNHFGTASMSINYTQQILKLSPKLKPASDISKRIQKVQTSYLQHQDEAKLLANFTLTELNTEGIDCKSAQLNVLNALVFKTVEMRTYLQNALSTNIVNFITRPEQRDTATQNIRAEVVYLQAVEKFLSSGCLKQVKLTSSYFVSNPNANNWILGDWNYDAFIKSYIGFMNTQAKVTKCPLSTPFFDAKSQKCINCFYPNNVWNMKLQQCSACPYSQVVNLKTRTCVSEIKYVNNVMDENYPWITQQKNLDIVYQKFNKEKSLESSVVCPFDTPFILNEKCSTCPQKMVYLLESRKCMAIPYNMEYDRNLHKVVEKLTDYQTSPSVSGNIQTGLKGCPAQLPYFDSLTCINCVFPNYFNQKRMKCQPCVNLEACGSKKIIYVTNSLGSNVTAKSTKQVKDYFNSNADKFKDQQVQQCDIKTPYYNPSQRRCIQCPDDKFLFNISTLQCVSCPQKTYFNQSTYMCEQPKGVKTNSKAKNLIVDNVTSYNAQQSKISGAQCMESVPYFNGKQCISCQSGLLFNTTSKTCVSCPKDTGYDNVLLKCDKIKYKTNSLTDRLWIQNLIKYQADYKINQGKQCPATSPFFNGVSCMNCLDTEIFNTSSLKCTKCPVGTVFDNINKNCTEKKMSFFVPGKVDNLLGVPSYTVDKYLTEVSNPDKTLYNVVKCGDDQNSKKTGCVKCNQNYTFFSVKTMECVACKNFSKEQKICYDNMTYLTNTTGGKDKMLGNSADDVDKYIKEQETKAVQGKDFYLVCPGDKPFAVKGQCQQCEQYFNVVSFQCSKCDFLDSATKTCSAKPLVSNLKYGVPPYYTSNSSKFLQDYDKAIKNGTQVCPFSTPFFNGKECVLCGATDDYFNLDTRKCENCTTGYRLNNIINECQQSPTKQYTDLSSQRLVFDGQPISYYQFKVEQAKKAGASPCGKDKPYYTKNGQCEMCNEPTPYFNLLRRVCTQCPEKTTYVPQDHQCESAIGDVVTPQATLEKSLANLFTA